MSARAIGAALAASGALRIALCEGVPGDLFVATLLFRDAATVRIAHRADVGSASCLRTQSSRDDLSTEISSAQAAHGKPCQHQDALLVAYANRKETNDNLNAASGSGVEKRSFLNTPARTAESTR
jgi:hypothetical protein